MSLQRQPQCDRNGTHGQTRKERTGTLIIEDEVLQVDIKGNWCMSIVVIGVGFLSIVISQGTRSHSARSSRTHTIKSIHPQAGANTRKHFASEQRHNNSQLWKLTHGSPSLGSRNVDLITTMDMLVTDVNRKFRTNKGFAPSCRWLQRELFTEIRH